MSCQFVCLSLFLLLPVCVRLPICLPVTICQSARLSVYLPAYLFLYSSVYSCANPSVCLFVYLRTNILTSNSPAIRLRGSSLVSAGRLEVYHVGRSGKGRWGTVCGQNFDINDANVACKELNFEGAEMTVPCCHPFSGGSGPIWMDSLRCQGREPSIFMCPHRGWGITHCSHDDDVGIICKTKDTVHSGKGHILKVILINVGDIYRPYSA